MQTLIWRRYAWRWLLSLAAGLALAGGLSTASWLVLSDRPTRAPETVELVIPTGTAERVRASAAAPSIPADMVFVQGDTLVLRNQDSVDHRVGPFSVRAGGITELTLDRPSSQSFLCTIHPAGYIGVVVRSRANPLAILWPTLVLGIPLGGVLGAVHYVASRIGVA